MLPRHMVKVMNARNASDIGTTREQGNRKIALGLGLFAVAVFLSMIIRQWMANS